MKIEKKKQIKNQVMQCLRNGAYKGVCRFEVIVEDTECSRYFRVNHLKHTRDGTTINIFRSVRDEQYQIFEFHTSFHGTDVGTSSYGINDFFQHLEEDTQLDEFFGRLVTDNSMVGECYYFIPDHLK